MRGKGNLCENRSIGVSGARSQTLRMLQLQHLYRLRHTNVLQSRIVLGRTTHDLSSKGAL